jgi:hypothetical protein
LAALDGTTSTGIGKGYPRHRASEFRPFLDQIEARIPSGLDVHLVWNNDAPHTTAIIRDRLAKRPRGQVHLTPTRRSWLTQVERFFAWWTQRQIKRGVHRSGDDVEGAINAFLHQHSAPPKAFKWIKTADDILAAIEPFCIYNTTPNSII